jgi:hydrogenase nickel incorporation protein HypA/HybF
LHELSLAHSLVEIVCEALPRVGGGKVRAVRLTLGALAGVVADSLEFCYDIVTRDTPLEGSRLVIRTIPVAIHCPACDRTFELPGVQHFHCSACGTPSADIRRGREIEVESIEVESSESEVAEEVAEEGHP